MAIIKGQDVWFFATDDDTRKSICKGKIIEVFKNDCYLIKDVGTVKEVFVSREQAVKVALVKLKEQYEAIELIVQTHYYDIKKKMVVKVIN